MKHLSAIILTLLCVPLWTSALENTAYQNGDYKKAITQYEDWLEKNGTNADVLFNLGNAYYQTADYGNAIYNFERAKALKPLDKEVKQNLALARKTAGMEAPGTGFAGPFGILTFNTWAKWLIFTILLAAIAFASRWLSQADRYRKPINIAMYISLVIAVLSSIALLVRKPELKRAIVISEAAQIRLSPFATADEVEALKPGQSIKIVDQHKDFYRVENGWVSKNEARLIYHRKP